MSFRRRKDASKSQKEDASRSTHLHAIEHRRHRVKEHWVGHDYSQTMPRDGVALGLSISAGGKGRVKEPQEKTKARPCSPLKTRTTRSHPLSIWVYQTDCEVSRVESLRPPG